MNAIKTSAAVAAIALLAAGTGCAPGANHHVTSRGVVSATSGGSQEVWLVMSEVASDYDKNKVWLRRDVFAVYHCIPAGCKRVGEISGLDVQERKEAR